MPNNLINSFVRNLLLIIYWIWQSGHCGQVDYCRQHLKRLLERKKEPPKCQLLNAGVCVLSNSKSRAAIFRHDVSGKNVVVTTDNTIAKRIDSYGGGYVFISEFLKKHEFVEIKVNKISKSFIGGLALGLTTREITSLHSEVMLGLTNDPPEMYVFSGINGNPAENDSIFLWLLCTGELQMRINDREPEILCKLDPSKKYTLFIDVCNTVEEIRVFIHDVFIDENDCTDSSDRRFESQPDVTPSAPLHNDQETYTQPEQPSTTLTPSHSEMIGELSQFNMSVRGNDMDEDAVPSPQSEDSVYVDQETHTQPGSSLRVESDEIKAELELESRVKKQTSLQAGNKPDNRCVVCLEREVNMLIYKCGHRCLCLNCGRDLYIKGNGRCPLCRMMITDVIRIYD